TNRASVRGVQLAANGGGRERIGKPCTRRFAGIVCRADVAADSSIVPNYAAKRRRIVCRRSLVSGAALHFGLDVGRSRRARTLVGLRLLGWPDDESGCDLRLFARPRCKARADHSSQPHRRGGLFIVVAGSVTPIGGARSRRAAIAELAVALPDWLHAGGHAGAAGRGGRSIVG